MINEHGTDKGKRYSWKGEVGCLGVTGVEREERQEELGRGRGREIIVFF